MKNNVIFLILGLGLITFLLLRVSRYYWAYRLTKWATDQGLKLIEFRGAWFFEGPSAWIRSENQSAFHVLVEDARGKRRKAWVTFGSWWRFVLGEPLSDVRWEDETT